MKPLTITNVPDSKVRDACIIGQMSIRLRRDILCSILISIMLISLPACGKSGPASTPTPAQPTNTFTPTITPIPPTSTPTPVPLAASVNGEGITLAEFQAELSRYQAAASSGTSTPQPAAQPAAGDKQRVLDDLIDQVLLAQGAAQQGYKADDAAQHGKFSPPLILAVNSKNLKSFL